MEKKQEVDWSLLKNKLEGSDKEEAIVQVVEMFVQQIYDNESYDCMKRLEESGIDLEICRKIEKEVFSRTDFFIKTIELRKMDFNEQITKIKKAYGYRYREYENDDFICEKLQLNKEQIKEIWQKKSLEIV